MSEFRYYKSENEKKWKLPKMLDLSRYEYVIIDTETTGINPHQDKTVGTAIGVYENGKIRSMYYPYGHDGGPQYSKSEVLEWLGKELRNKRLIFHNSHFDLMMLLNEGLDLRQHGNQILDTMIDGPLLDANGYYSLDAMCAKYLGIGHQKIKMKIPIEEIQYYPSYETGPYAEQDINLTGMLIRETSRLIKKRDLTSIRNLERAVVPAVVEMMQNGLHMDISKLNRWIEEVSIKHKEVIKQLKGVNPNSSKELQIKFDELGIKYQYNWSCDAHDKEITWSGYKPQTCPMCEREILTPISPHFGKKYLLKETHPFAKLVLKARQYYKLLHTFLIPWSQEVTPEGILYYNLNQLRDRHRDGSTRGTVSGRFSASMINGGAQPQQIWSVENQLEELGDEFILRELFTAERDDLYVVKWDASQIEYRLFADYSNSEDLIRAYQTNPDLDYHQTVADEVLNGRLPRKKAKNINFGKLFGMGYAHFAREMQCSRSEGKEMYDLYDAMFPEAKETINRFSRQASHTGKVRTLRGREFTFPKPCKNAYVAMNRVIQGSAADIMKEALTKLYDSRLLHKMRLTVHDECMGDIESEEKAKQGKELLEDVKGLRVPILWDLEIGKNWAMR